MDLKTELINLGSHSLVYKCTENSSLMTQYAVKIMDTNMLKRGHENRYLREIEIMQTLDHPNIVQIHEYFQEENKIFLVMELCRGGDLQQKINWKREMAA